MEALLTPTEVAFLLKIPVKTLYQWRYMRTGPPAHKLRRHLRYRRRDVEDWIDNEE
jgi:excisionase family DNA binding protein